MKYFILIVLMLMTITPVVVLAQQGTGVSTFQDLPGLENVSNLTTQQYIDALYVIAIVAASILAVFKLIMAGVKYMLSEVVTNKQKAKDDIRGALLGLLIILGAVTLLNTINPNLTNLDFLRNADPTRPVPGVGGTPSSPNASCPAGQANRCGPSNGTTTCRCLKLLK